MNAPQQYDVAILGSGFGGSLLSSILAKRGMRVCLIDRESHPRFTIGESSTPAADLILHSLAEKYGLGELMPLCRFGSWRETYSRIRCGCKRGFSYIWHGDSCGYRATADHQHELLVAASSNRDVADTQWYRADVDQFFHSHAIQQGVESFDHTNVLSIERSSGQSWRILAERHDSQLDVECEFIVDATGSSGVLLRSLGIDSDRQQLQTNSMAVFSHFDDVSTAEHWLFEHNTHQEDFPYRIDDSAVHHLFPEGWLWQLRFESGPTSLGFAFSPDSFRDLNGATAESFWRAIQSRYRVIEELLSGSTLSHTPGRLVRSHRLQRLASSAAGENWAALPFTVGFIDPLHSTGIAHTLLGVQRLAEILLGPVKNRTEHLADYSQQLQREFRLIDLLVAGCYRSLSSFENFTAWTMLYFAAATTFERCFNRGDDNFLCASDSDFFDGVSKLYDLNFSNTRQSRPDESLTVQVARFIEPYNKVGLFSPPIPNMYFHTVATK